MASIAIMVGGAVLNVVAFISGNYLVRALRGGDKAAFEEKVRHDKDLEAYQAPYAKYMQDRTKLLDCIATNTQIKAEAKQNFTNTDYAFKLFNQAHPNELMIPPTEPKFSDFYQPSEQQKQGELLFVGGRHSLSAMHLSIFSEQKQRFGNGRQACQILLQSPGLLERHHCHQKISRHCKCL